MSQPTSPDGVDLARADWGGMVIAANDEFFAPKENLILAADPVWDAERYVDTGKWMDGWETRRRRVKGHDWAIVRLASAGVLRSVDINTAHFTGNYPPHASLEGAWFDGHPSVEEVLADDVSWVPLLGRVPLEGDAHNRFAVPAEVAVTHVRLRIFPDGGVARLRAYGDPIAPWSRLGPTPDLASVLCGGLVLAVSDEFYGVRHNLLSPGRAQVMRDGWEVRRRRDDGHDWCVVRLGAPGTVSRAEIDTNHFKGNCPGACAIEAASWPGPLPADLDAIAWRPLLGRTRLQPHTQHLLADELSDAGVVDLVRVHIFPDGGLSRLRLWGTPGPGAVAARGVARLDRLPTDAARAALTNCCGATSWVNAMLAQRPFGDMAALLRASDDAWAGATTDDVLAALSHHPRIGAKTGVSAQSTTAAAWSSREQATAAAGDLGTLDRLATLNARYEERFGFTYVVCAAGRAADDLLAHLEHRVTHERDAELAVAAVEQHKITALRLHRLLHE